MRAIVLSAGVGALLVASTTSAQSDSSLTAESKRLTAFDIAQERAEIGAPVDARETRFRAAFEAGREAVAPNRAAAVERFRFQRPDVRIDLCPLTGCPTFVRSIDGALTEADPAAAPRETLRRFAAANADLFGLRAEEIAAARQIREHALPGGVATAVTLRQQHEGIDIFESGIRASVDGRGRLMTASSRMMDPGQAGWTTRARRLNVGQAIQAAAWEFRLRVPAMAPQLNAFAEPNAWVRLAPEGQLKAPLEARQTWFMTGPDTLTPAWELAISPAGSSSVFHVVVDAFDGSILLRRNATVHAGPVASYRVYADPVTFKPFDSPAPLSPGPATPDGTQAANIARSLVTISSFDDTASPSGWVETGSGAETLGNNVDAHTDLGADDFPDLPRPTADFITNSFDFPLNLANDPATNAEALVTHVFYVGNWYHDRLYQLGFTETAGNFQNDNFGRGGLGGDRISAQSLDGSGTNNANFGTLGSDGSFAITQNFRFDGPNPDRASSLDTQIVIHEFTHGTSIRLHEGLNTSFAAGLGEGWSDFYAVAMLADDTDDIDGTYQVGGYATLNFLGLAYDDNYYSGIRRYPYSRDFSVNPLTYADANPATFAVDPSVPRSPLGSSNPAAVHNVGEIWCNTLLEMRANLIETHGFAVGNEMALQLVTDGMAIAPSSPTFLQSRDAILAADTARHAGANRCLIWEAFAKRGAGFSAGDSNSGTTSGITEAFDVPEGFTVAIADDTLALAGIGDPVVPSTITALECGDALNASSPTLIYSINGAPDVETPLQLVSGSSYDIVFPNLRCDDFVEWRVRTTDINAIDYFSPPLSDDPFTSIAVTDTAVNFEDDVETDTGWTVGAPGDTATTGQWARVDPVGSAAQPEDDNTAAGTICFVTGNAGPGDSIGTNDVDNGFTTLISPAFDATGGEAYITLYYWHSNGLGNNPGEDQLTIDISSDDGANYTNAFFSQGAGTQWNKLRIRVADHVTPTSTVRLRIRTRDEGAGGSIVESAIDDVKLEIFSCTPVYADLNFDDVVDASDLSLLLNGFLATPVDANWNPDADLNGDNIIDPSDLSLLLAEL